jgi:hypothetical protein
VTGLCLLGAADMEPVAIEVNRGPAQINQLGRAQPVAGDQGHGRVVVAVAVLASCGHHRVNLGRRQIFAATDFPGWEAGRAIQLSELQKLRPLNAVLDLTDNLLLFWGLLSGIPHIIRTHGIYDVTLVG